MTDSSSPGMFRDIAVAKLDKVLGPRQGPVVLATTLGRLGMTTIDSADDLFRVGADLERQGGFTATVGALLCLSAVMHGAVGQCG